jgi:hypothetical protein
MGNKINPEHYAVMEIHTDKVEYQTGETIHGAVFISII